MPRMSARRGERLTFLALLGIVFLLAVVPMGRLAQEALAPRGALDLRALDDVLQSPAVWRAARNTLTVSIGGAALAVVVGCAFALLVSLTDVRAKKPLVFCFMTPLLIAPQVTALAWINLLGPNSTLLRAIGLAPAPGTTHPLYGPGGIVLLLGLEQSPVVFLAVRAGLRALPRDLVEAAQAAGAKPLRIVRTIVLPLMMPSVAAGAMLAFVGSIGNFGIPAFLGIPAGFTVLVTLIYQRLAGFGTSVLSEVAALSLLLALIALCGLALNGWISRRRDVRVTAWSSAAPQWTLGRYRVVVEGVCWAGLFAVLVLPFAALLATALVPAIGVSLSPKTLTFANFHFVLFDYAATRRAFLNSASLAAGAAVLLVIVAVPLGYSLAARREGVRQTVGFVSELPYAVPGVVLAIAMILCLLRPIPLLGLSLYSTIWIILVAYLSRFMLLALRPVANALRQIDPSLDEAARMSGARYARRIATVIMPMVAPSAIAGGMLVFLMAFNELTVSALLWSSGSETVGVVLFSLEQAGDGVSAAAVAVIAVVVTLSMMLLANRLASRVARGVLPWQP
ncbi:MAG TPA: iron ABC transporter permease [Casimicrobiaceae bacterium]|nr:iron ABC transporter permease [Casimicrobiaceae bacterium]